jgi:hypothetical protein
MKNLAMKSNIYASVIILIMLLISNNGLAQITTDYDKSVDFTKFKTFTFIGWAEHSDEHITDLDKDRIIAAFENEFKSRNLVKDTINPDMAISLYVVIKNKTSVTSYSNYYGGMGYGRSFGYGYGGGYGSTTTSQRDYREGTIIIDFYDEKEKSLIWEGILKKEVKEKAKKRDKSIPENIRKLMYKYPIKPVKK